MQALIENTPNMIEEAVLLEQIFLNGKNGFPDLWTGTIQEWYPPIGLEPGGHKESIGIKNKKI